MNRQRHQNWGGSWGSGFSSVAFKCLLGKLDVVNSISSAHTHTDTHTHKRIVAGGTAEEDKPLRLKSQWPDSHTSRKNEWKFEIIICTIQSIKTRYVSDTWVVTKPPRPIPSPKCSCLRSHRWAKVNVVIHIPLLYALLQYWINIG